MSKLPVIAKEKSLANLSPLQLYLREIAKYPLLEPEEEYELAVSHFEDEDIDSAHRLITSNLRLVVKIANDFRQAQVNLLDLIQEGNYGLMQAVKKYNPYKGVKLSSYAAWWIRAYILKYIMDNKSQVKIGTTAAQRKLFFNLKKEADRLLQEYETIDAKLIAESLDVKESEVIEMQKRLSAPDVSIDAPVNVDTGTASRGDFLSNNEESIDEVLANEEERNLFKIYMDEFIEHLEGRDLEFFKKRFLEEPTPSLKALGDEYGISRERARQIETKLIGKLREFVKEKGVLDI